MFDIAPSEFLLVAFVALVVIGPKDLPKAMRVLGYWVGRARAVGRQFRNGFDEMVREAELEEMEKKWKAENERIMREHPFVPTPPASPALPDHASGSDEAASGSNEAPGHGDTLPHDDTQQPVMVEKPHVVPGGIPDPAPPPVAHDNAHGGAEPRNDDHHAADGRVVQDKAAS
ncbi:sec-independent protein translocase protein TatB [Sphingomonas endophytica]|uniref:Sec-independent protein translocase protein TatB n=1 Tax=Sphingomonas endophytica TaxID=869719 RepID=A0A7X0MMR2_9SPHN|nr:Sec-independent protein translocase protein TatB [Sphingomonas endophytica]MBB6503270.1 sec-independent protein translocase protein TatB [Sphingomonas endophytica]